MIKKVNKLDIKNKNKIILSNGKEFDILKFQQALENNNKKIDKIKNAGIIGSTINIFSGRQAEVTLEALNLNNQFIEFTKFVHEILLTLGMEAREHRSEIESVINSRDESLSKTENQLLDVITKLNDKEKKIDAFLVENKNIMQDIKDLNSKIDYLNNNDINKINNDLLHSTQSMNEMKEQISVLTKKDKFYKILLSVIVIVICWILYYFI